MRLLVDGEPASPELLSAIALNSYGHFTSMQVREHRVRGLRQHLTRLDTANRELFGEGLDGGIVRDHVRRALGDTADASVRVTVIECQDSVRAVVTVRPPASMQAGTVWKLRSVPYLRSVAHIKHASDFGQAYYLQQVTAAGYDEALLTGPDGIIAEGSLTNVGFFDGTQVTWPAAPALSGITMQLIEPRLADAGLPCRRDHVRLGDLPGMAGMFVTNSRGIAAVSLVDGQDLPVDQDLMKTLRQVYDSAGWDAL